MVMYGKTLYRRHTALTPAFAIRERYLHADILIIDRTCIKESPLDTPVGVSKTC